MISTTNGGGGTVDVGEGLRIELNAVSPNLIGGYDGNSASQGVSGAAVGGGGRPAGLITTPGVDGDPNLVTDDFGAIGGGIGNRAGDGSGTTGDAPYAAVGGGRSNTASGTGSTVPGGSENIADGVNSFAAGSRASAAHDGSFVWSDRNPPLSIGPRFVSTGENQFLIRARGGVGINTSAPATELDVEGTVRMTGLELPTGAGAGLVLTSDGDGAASWQPGGGGGSGWGLDGNSGTDSSSDFIGTNDDEGLEFRVNGLRALRIEPTSSIPNLIGAFGFVGEGVVGATVGGGSGFLFALHGVVGDYGTVGGGLSNQAEALATVSGGNRNGASGTGSTISGGSKNQASTSHGTVGGGFANRALARYATIAGGGATDTLDATTGNRVLGDYGTIGGGGGNRASSDFSTVSGGRENVTEGENDTVGGGRENTASGGNSTVAGGRENTATGLGSSIAGGFGNEANGQYSFAVGLRAKVDHDGSFVLADATDQDVSSSANNQFTARASGGVRFFTTSSLSAGVSLTAGGSSWQTVSDRNAKENIRTIDTRLVLERLAGIPVQTWNYKTQNSAIRHMGPMAQDFSAAFGLGLDDKHINTVDADGVALAAIQGLYTLVKEKDAEIVSQKDKIDCLETRVKQLEEMVRMIAGKDYENGLPSGE